MKIFFGYLLAHFLLYFFIFRRARPFAREKTIFLYHFLSGIVWALFAGSKLGPAVFGATLSLHGIYSLTFLEFWSLSGGGYSLRILVSLPDLAKLQDLGREKKGSRLKDLVRLGFVGQRGGKFYLTVFGKTVTAFLQTVSWSSNPGRADA